MPKGKNKLKSKETPIFFTRVKVKEEDQEGESDEFIAASTVPDRVKERLPDGRVLEGEILSKNVLDKIASYINDDSTVGGKYGSYRTISLFHDRVKSGDYTLEEAGFVKPGSARVVEMESSPGNFALIVKPEVNKMYKPSEEYADWTAEKIQYKLNKDALGLSLEYTNEPHQERIVEHSGSLYRYVFDTDDFRGFGFARPNLIGNPRAVRVKEIMFNESSSGSEQKNKGEKQMDEAKIKELEQSLADANAKVKELEEEKKAAEESGAEAKVEELKEEMKEMDTKVKEMKLKLDNDAAKIKESIELAFSSANFNAPAKNVGEVKSAKVKEAYTAFGTDFVKFKEIADEHIEANSAKLKEMLSRTGTGFAFEDHQTVKVKCAGSKMIVVPTAKTKDVIDASDMAESTYNQTNAMFADRYVAGITETFLMEDSLLTAMSKEQHLGGNDQYQWRIWTEFATVTGTNTLAVDPNVTSVGRTQRNFEKMQTPIREYRDGVEVTDFTQHHSMAAVGDLLGIQMMRAAKAVTQSMAADLFKNNTEATAGWVGFNGLIGYADSTTNTTLYGKTRSAANRLLDATLAK